MLPVIHLANLLTLPDGRTVEWEALGNGEPLLWIEGGPPSRRGRARGAGVQSELGTDGEGWALPVMQW